MDWWDDLRSDLSQIQHSRLPLGQQTLTMFLCGPQISQRGREKVQVSEGMLGFACLLPSGAFCEPVGRSEVRSIHFPEFPPGQLQTGVLHRPQFSSGCSSQSGMDPGSRDWAPILRGPVGWPEARLTYALHWVDPSHLGLSRSCGL